MYSPTVFLLLPLLSTIASRSIPNSHAVERAIPNSHHQRDTLPHGRKLIRRRKRSTNSECQASSSGNSTSAAVSTSAIGQNTWANSTKSQSSTSSEGVTSSSTTSSSTSSAAAESSSASSGSGSGSSGLSALLKMLFPVSVSSSWTTASDDSSALSFDSALQPIVGGHWPSNGSAPDGSNSLIAPFTAGLYSLKNNQGMQFYTEGNSAVDITSASEAVFSYSAYFPEGFEFNKGGKMPGLFGGVSLDAAKSCSGGSKRNDCFSARLMWRTDGKGEFYNYFPVNATQPAGYCSTPPMSTCNPDYGDSIGRGSFYWATGAWTTVAQRFKLNDAGVSNGEQELYVNGESVLSLTGLQMSVSSDTKIFGIMAQVFFGGSDSSWASPQDQDVYFKDWSLAVIS